jgi:hypothetical protein
MRNNYCLGYSSVLHRFKAKLQDWFSANLNQMLRPRRRYGQKPDAFASR